MSSKENFQQINYWIKEIEMNSSDNVDIVLIGKKIDKENER